MTGNVTFTDFFILIICFMILLTLSLTLNTIFTLYGFTLLKLRKLSSPCLN